MTQSYRTAKTGNMALRNYMYYKHEDDLKDKIAHNISPANQQVIPAVQIIPKVKKLTPTQIRKLEKLKLEENAKCEKSAVN